jgi:hypothetical protein
MPALPPEIWLKVFRHCDYFSLKKLQHVSKTFQIIMTAKQLDPQLFRLSSIRNSSSDESEQGTGVKEACLNGTIQLHPILQRLHEFVVSTSGARAAYHLLMRYFGGTASCVRFSQTLLHEESAVWPPSVLVGLELDGDRFSVGGYEEIEDWEDGERAIVTVLHVIDETLEAQDNVAEMQGEGWEMSLHHFSIEPQAQKDGVLKLDLWYKNAVSGEIMDAALTARRWREIASDSSRDLSAGDESE